jgi:hypothetical protein
MGTRFVERAQLQMRCVIPEDERMKYIIARDGRYYAGFFDGKPTWSRTRTPETQFDADIAERIAQQLKGLGFVGVEVQLYQPRKKAAAA